MTTSNGATVDHDALAGEESDETLAARVAGRDVAAFGLLFDRYAQTIYVFAAHLLGTADADEIVQEVFLRFWNRAGQFDSLRGSFRGWFMAIARHQILNELRRRSQEQRRLALDADEHAAVAAHLAGCPTCQRLADELTDVANALPQALAAASPHRLPTTAKARLLQSLDAPTPTVASSGDLDIVHDSATPPPTPAPLASGQASGAGAALHRRWPRWRPRTLGTLAATLVAVLALGWGVQLSFALARERALRAEFHALLSGQQALVIDVIDSSKTVKAMLRATQPGSKAYGKLFTRPDMPNVVIMAGRLPDPPTGQSYNVWLMRAGTAQLAGELALNAGFGALVFDAGQTGLVYDSAQVVLQPRTSTSPTGTIVLQWQASP
jgi:RNA polymerase sigma factor (sigma-70 family)